MPSAADTIRILVATDSHVGYAERDPIRKDDSWKSFDEVMQLAKTHDVDMVLLAGDLFHENKPSRKAMYQVMRSLRKNCLGEKPCELEFLSDASDVFDGAFNIVNYEDPDINVAIPVFSIHGNHDDPSGDGHYCSLDLLQVAGLLNYFGRIPQNDKIEIKPLLLQKGQTKLALYGLSNVRDERLFRTFRDPNGVKIFTPGQQKKDWFNLMAVHQNHHAHSATGYLPENFLPDFMDLVVWGHEHECIVKPSWNPEMNFRVLQPGSSIATSLVSGEAEAKHAFILNVSGKDFTIEKYRIKSVRPFITEELVLATDSRFKSLAAQENNKSKLSEKLVRVVDELIQEATNEWLSIQDEDVPAEDIPLPLVRLKVEYSAPDGGKFDIENPQRFSNRFVGKVANVHDVVVFHRKKIISRSNKSEKEMPSEEALAAIDNENVKVDKLVQEYLAAQSLKILPKDQFGDAVTEFVVKGDKNAMDEFVNESLTTQVKELLLANADDEEELIDGMDRVRAQQEALFKAGVLKRNKKKRKLKPRPANWDSDEMGEWEDSPAARVLSDEEADGDGAPAGRRKKSVAISDDDDDGASMMSGTTKKTTAKKAPAKRAPAKPRAPAKAKAPAKAAAKTPAGRGRKKAIPEPSDDEDNDSDVIMMDEPPPVKSQPRRAAATKGRQTTINFSQSQAAKPSTARELSDDEISDDDDAFEPMTSSKRR